MSTFSFSLVLVIYNNTITMILTLKVRSYFTASVRFEFVSAGGGVIRVPLRFKRKVNIRHCSGVSYTSCGLPFSMICVSRLFHEPLMLSWKVIE